MIESVGAKAIHDALTNQVQSQFKMGKMEEANIQAFQGLLSSQIQEVNELQYQSDLEVQKFLTGDTENLHDVMISMEEAKIGLELLTQTRNKLVEGYQEIKSMQI